MSKFKEKRLPKILKWIQNSVVINFKYKADIYRMYEFDRSLNIPFLIHYIYCSSLTISCKDETDSEEASFPSYSGNNVILSLSHISVTP